MADISTANLDSSTDNPGSARAQLLTTVQAVNALRRSVYNVRDPDFGAVGDGVTSDQAAVVAAVAAASTAGDDLWWPDGTYLTTASIPNLHSVRHFGPGAIKRGSTLFYVDPKQGQSNTLYVAPTGGSATNDGLSASEAMSSFQVAFNALKSYGPILCGSWTVQSAAGTHDFSAGAQTLEGLASVNRVVVQGPSVGGHPNVPTAIIDGGATATNYLHGLQFKGTGLNVQVQDLKFIRFNGSPAGTRGALLFDDSCDGYAVNVHVTGSSWFGIYGSQRTLMRVSGGIIDGCRNGINTDGAKASIGYGATSLAQGPIIKNCTESGIYWARGTDGHHDYVSFEDNAVGADIDSNSRTDSVGCTFKRNTVGVRTSNGGVFGNNPGAPCNFNIGTADANTTPWEYRAYSGESDEGTAAHSEMRVAYDRTTRSASGTTPATLTTPYTIAAGRMIGVGKSMRVEVFGIYTVTAGSVLSVTFGGMTLNLTVPSAATGVAFNLRVTLHDVGGGYRCFGELNHSLSTARTGTATAGFVNTSANAITVGCTLAGAGDSINLYRTNVYAIG